MQRRGFLGALLAAGVAPTFVGSSVLMPVRKIITPEPLPLQHTVIFPSFELVEGDTITIAGIFESGRSGRLKEFRIKQVVDGTAVIGQL